MKVRSTRLGMIRLRLNRVAPVLAIVLMTGGWFLIERPMGEDPSIIRHRERIADEVSGFPYQLDNWWGSDVPVPTSAMEILRPNSMVSRKYSRLDGSEEVVLALIHCSDLRDMVGHYPPVCYPAIGWTLEDPEIERIEVRLSDVDVEMALYRFHRLDQDGLEQRQTVLSVFLLPNELVLTDMEELKGRSTRSRSMSAIGVAQLQMVFDDAPGTDRVVEQATELLSAIPKPIVSALYAPLQADPTVRTNESGRPG